MCRHNIVICIGVVVPNTNNWRKAKFLTYKGQFVNYIETKYPMYVQFKLLNNSPIYLSLY
jgi:hypothetical protein